MIRFRRYRVFLVGATVLLLFLFRAAQNSQWELQAASAVYGTVRHELKVTRPQEDSSAQKPLNAPPKPDTQPPAKQDLPNLKPNPTLAAVPAATTPAAKDAKGPGSATPGPAAVNMPDRVPDQRPVGHDREAPKPKKPAKPSPDAGSDKSKLHWVKPQEQYPIPDEEVIPLPTGKPKAIPKIQHQFAKESPAAKEKRETRLAQIKAETLRAWNSYRKYAWGHDEISPIQLKPRDPFCGWAATLVDSMDTLWIMGLKDEFEDAYKALDKIDFTTTDRNEIPVFETIIRYMGGLLAAYDVSGGKEGKHPNLLRKVEELANVLMSVFDTPNRMPVLYYQWQPQFANNHLRASTMVSVAELGSMSMEFTRLAQLTGNNRYYDAIARITNAFEDWQKRGTALDGLFPQQIDASGCNLTAIPDSSSTLVTRDVSDAIRPPAEEEGEERRSKKKAAKLASRAMAKANAGASRSGGSAASASNKDADGSIPSVPQGRFNAYANRDRSGATQSSLGRDSGPHCPPQGLTETSPGFGQYGMGGSQDSAYEYFPKQYLLLGGLVDQYKTMHEKVVDGVKKYLLYRPMVKDEQRKLLFSAAVYARGSGKDLSLTYNYEVTHLTCFLGGMFALGGKIFNSPDDVEIGTYLADGCVWAYESTESGIMPENSNVVPCETVASCPWNETVWYDHLDPNAEWRKTQTAEYWVQKKKWDNMYEEQVRKQKAKEDAEWEAKKARVAGNLMPFPKKPAAKEQPAAKPRSGSAPSPGFSVLDGAGPGTNKEASHGAEKPSSGRTVKRSVELADSQAGSSIGSRDSARAEKEEGRALAMVGAEGATGGVRSTISIEEANSKQSLTWNPLWDLPPPPVKPVSHEEYVDERIMSEKLPPGFTSVVDKRYILRPEAIESVWYMYRITGDTTWQEKGWRMWEAVVAATRTENGHSAIENVLTRSPAWSDNMESFWIAETLKYFYLLFSTPDVISLDDWVLNTEAHPFRRPT